MDIWESSIKSAEQYIKVRDDDMFMICLTLKNLIVCNCQEHAEELYRCYKNEFNMHFYSLVENSKNYNFNIYVIDFIIRRLDQDAFNFANFLHIYMKICTYGEIDHVKLFLQNSKYTIENIIEKCNDNNYYYIDLFNNLEVLKFHIEICPKLSEIFTIKTHFEDIVVFASPEVVFYIMKKYDFIVIERLKTILNNPQFLDKVIYLINFSNKDINSLLSDETKQSIKFRIHQKKSKSARK